MTDIIVCVLHYHGKTFEGRGNCRESATQRALDMFYSFFGTPNEKQADDIQFEYKYY